MREKMRERIDLMMMWKLTRALDLDEETAAKLFPLLHESNQQQRKLHENRRDIIRQLQAEVEKDQPDSAAMRGLMDKFKQNEREAVELKNKKLDDISKVLSEKQTVQFIIFGREFMRDVRDLAYGGRGHHRRQMRNPDRDEEDMPPGPRRFSPFD